MVSRLSVFVLPSILLLFGHGNYALGQQGTSSAIIQFHGSGSTVPSRCYSYILETMRAQAKLPTWTTFRAISSGPGQDDFMGNITHPYSDFGSSDYPLSSEQYNTLKNASQAAIHLPVLLSAIGIFHSLPLQMEHESSTTMFVTANHLNLTSCLVARIYQGEIDDWTHPDIKELNPGMKLPVQLDDDGKPKSDQGFPIKVAHRNAGSSSTLTLTSYLHKACPEHWGADLVGSDVDWPMSGSDRLFIAEGTSGMIAIIQNETGIIGYTDSGAGVEEGLREVALRMEQTSMKEPFFLTSENAVSKDGIAAVLEGIQLPSSGSDDWSGINIIDEGEEYIYAWPMVMISYVLVRQDLTSFIPDPRAQTFMVQFLKSLYDPDYNERCETEFLLQPVRGAVRDLALQSIDTLEVSDDAPVWIKEADVLTGTGQGDYVISARRQESFLMQQDLLSQRLGVAEVTLEEAVSNMSELKTVTLGVKQDLEKVASKQGKSDRWILADKSKRINASFGMAIASLLVWFVTALLFCHQQAKLRELESRPRVVQPEPQRKKKREENENV